MALEKNRRTITLHLCYAFNLHYIATTVSTLNFEAHKLLKRATFAIIVLLLANIFMKIKLSLNNHRVALHSGF